MAKKVREQWNGMRGYDAIAQYFNVSTQTVFYYRKKCGGGLAETAEMLVERKEKLDKKNKVLEERHDSTRTLWELALGIKK